LGVEENRKHIRQERSLLMTLCTIPSSINSIQKMSICCIGQSRLEGGSECFRQNRLPYRAEYKLLSASSTIGSQIPINSSCQIGSSQNSYGWIFDFIELHIKNALGSTCTPQNTWILKTLLGHKGLTHKCRTYDHGFKLSIHIQFFHLKFR
jgi:hypothetical protein